MEKYEIQRLRDLPIEQVAGRLGLSVARHKALCPFHDDHHASLSFNTRRNSCRCFVCMDSSMGTVDLVMRLLHADFPKACRWLADSHNIVLEKRLPDGLRTPHPAPSRPNPFDAARYAPFFEHPWLSAEARRFLFEERRIDPRVARWCRLTSWQDRDGTHWLQIPYFDQERRLVGVQNRNLDYRSSTELSRKQRTEDGGKATPGRGDLSKDSTDVPGKKEEGKEKPRFRFPYGAKCSIYNLPVLGLLSEGEPLYITEGCSDCWAMLSSGRKAIAIPSATLLKDEDRRLLAEVSQRLHTEWHMYPDRDAPGERLFLQLKELLPGLQHHQLPPGCKDFGEAHLIMNHL